MLHKSCKMLPKQRKMELKEIQSENSESLDSKLNKKNN